ncbi:HNH endonuclease signature motif containing protein [Agromyces albus]|uniref:HNH endonuclease n=1 Tax=Agromyces albus TaxID=205332 RepID=A0A4Q2L4A9_9MICO|nr:HNH endonuclease signature motif containing protein [Agromyces albus]RXZ70951.1 HNH endonuclease [Agromyces albus]
MRYGSNGWSTGHSERPDESPIRDDRSPYAIAQDGLFELIEASVQAQRVEAMNAAMRVDLIFLTVMFALRSEEAFVAASVTPERRREMAYRSVTAELATALHVPQSTMERQVSEAWALATELPATLGAMRNGQISPRHAAVIVEETADLGGDPALRAKLDEQLAVTAATVTAATLRRKARSLREDLRVASIAERHRAARAKRRIELEPARDGMAWLHALLPAPDALLIKDRLDRVALAARGDGGGITDQLRDDQLSADHLRADAARDLLLHGTLPESSGFAATMAGVRPTVHVTVPVFTLMGAGEAPGLLDGYGPIDADTTRRLAAAAPSFTRILTDPVSGTVLDVDRTRYRPPADLKRWLEVRDGTCRFPGCNRRAARCEVDHTIDWQHDGHTAFDNLAHLCSLHHHLKHETSWSVQHLADGVMEWRSPTGRVHVSHPRRRIPRDADSLGPPARETGGRRRGMQRSSSSPPPESASASAPAPRQAPRPEPPPF